MKLRDITALMDGPDEVIVWEMEGDACNELHCGEVQAMPDVLLGREVTDLAPGHYVLGIYVR